MARSLRPNDRNNYDGSMVPGYYSRIKLNDLINNFTVGYIGDDKALTGVPRHEVAFWAQRGVQEFSYDTLHIDKNIEVELSPSKTLLLPSDYVNLVRITKTDPNGNTETIQPTTTTRPTSAAIQDENYDYLYDANGDIITDQKSTTTQRFQTREYDEQRRAIDYYNGYYYNDDFSYYNQKRFGLQPDLANVKEGTYLVDPGVGVIYFDQNFNTDDIVTLYYVSDGLGDADDLDNVYVPKMAEDALYAYILYNLSKLRPSLAGVLPMYKKEASSKLRNTKIRLMNLKPEEMINVMRMKSKWIKH